jgi:hypothetical protein
VLSRALVQILNAEKMKGKGAAESEEAGEEAKVSRDLNLLT